MKNPKMREPFNQKTQKFEKPQLENAKIRNTQNYFEPNFLAFSNLARS